MIQHKKYFLARYDTKTDECLGVYESIDEAIWKVYGFDKVNPKYKTAKNSIIASYVHTRKANGNRRTAHGIWYKFLLNEYSL